MVKAVWQPGMSLDELLARLPGENPRAVRRTLARLVENKLAPEQIGRKLDEANLGVGGGTYAQLHDVGSRVCVLTTDQTSERRDEAGLPGVPEQIGRKLDANWTEALEERVADRVEASVRSLLVDFLDEIRLFLGGQTPHINRLLDEIVATARRKGTVIDDEAAYRRGTLIKLVRKEAATWAMVRELEPELARVNERRGPKSNPGRPLSSEQLQAEKPWGEPQGRKQA